MADLIEDLEGEGGVWRGRGVRVSITFRWMKPGADVVGDGDLMSVEDAVRP